MEVGVGRKAAIDGAPRRGRRRPEAKQMVAPAAGRCRVEHGHAVVEHAGTKQLAQKK
jgi:O-acetyl-ADP-ribose deacetylase (regulator of RNase III)